MKYNCQIRYSSVFHLVLLFLLFVVGTTKAFGGSDDRFIKKYAMMKIYESCFGPDVVKQIRKEMKAACEKCALFDGTTPKTPPSHHPHEFDSENSILPPPQGNFDAEKLHQAILAFRPNNPPPQGGAPFYRPTYPGVAAPFYTQTYPHNYQAPLFYPGYPINPAYGYPLVAQGPYYNNRVAREMELRSQLETLTSKMSSGRVRNVTCVMQELGYLDDNLEPNFIKINERIGNLPVSDELRRDMQDGVAFCQQFSQCVPEVRKEKSPLSRELIRPMFFFKCYKHKKLEACIMKDVREKYSGVSDDDFDSSDVEIRRTGKAMDMRTDPIDQLATTMYEFLYGTDSSLDHLDTLL